MKVAIPIYVELMEDGGGQRYECSALFVPGVRGADPSLAKATSRLARRLRSRLNSMAASSQHDELLGASFCPEMETRTLKLKLDLRDQLLRRRLLFVVVEALGRRIAFSPSIPQLWFELKEGESLRKRAEEVLTSHFRQVRRLARNDGELVTPPNLTGDAWVTTIELDPPFRQRSESEQAQRFAALFDESRVDGGVELERVGRCLDWQYPDELQRTVLRKAETQELLRAIDEEDRRPLLLVGPQQVGKTSILHEAVYRRVHRRKNPFANQRNVWLLSPQRLISGMSYVGQWENRLLAILREAERRDHVLYFDDLLGLYQAGVSSDSKLCVADVLRNFILRRQVRVVGEMTVEAFHRFQEQDRSLSDQFHVIPVRPTNDDDTMTILLQTRRSLEAELRCQIQIDALPTVIELQHRYVRDAAFPGKAAGFIRGLALKRRGKSIDQNDVYGEFHDKTGLSSQLIEKHQRLHADEIERGIRRRIIGQPEAVRTATDLLMTAKAGVNDSRRPLASLLFLGPTGVGKTQTAKLLAELLFTDAKRLIRFDMNEFVSAYAASRLVGAFHDPEGLLTSAVRRQPYCVVLLDEIEKAHPDVFDLLLQVLGEGRLTDSLGRTTDFTNAVIVMTSNLGVAESGKTVGLRHDRTSRRRTFVKAAEDFFRPEFFNRIDRIVPFGPLERDEVRRIARLMLGDLLAREGFVRRRCILEVDEDALERVVDEGYQPMLGARAMKRALEDQVAKPIARRLTAQERVEPTMISLFRGPVSIVARTEPLRDVEPTPQPHANIEPLEVVERLKQGLRRLRELIDSLRSETVVTSAGLSPDQLRYYALKEQWSQLQERTDALAQRLSAQVGRRPAMRASQQGYGRRIFGIQYSGRGSEKSVMREMMSAEDVNSYIEEIAATQTPKGDALAQDIARLAGDAAWLEAMWNSRDEAEQALLVFRASSSSASDMRTAIAWDWLKLFQELGYDTELIRLSANERDSGNNGGNNGGNKGGNSDDKGGPILAVSVSGAFCWPLVEREAGTYLIRGEGEVAALQAAAVLAPGSCEEAISEAARQQREWRREIRAGVETDNPWPLGAVVKFIEKPGHLASSRFIDIRTTRTFTEESPPGNRARVALAGLPPLPELLEARDA